MNIRHLSGSDLHRGASLWRSRPPISLRRRPGARRSGGFTILEALIGVVILTASIGALAVVTARQWSRSVDVNVLDRVENAVASDLGWLKTYAKYWRMTSGPYPLTCEQAGFDSGCTAFVSSKFATVYEPDPALCTEATGLAEDFVEAASTVTLTPARPFAIDPENLTQILLTSEPNPDPGEGQYDSSLPPGATLVRTITPGTNIVKITYSLTGGNAAAYGFLREAALQLEASAWCP